MLRRARPDLAWTSNQLTPGRISGSVISSRTPRFAVTCSTVDGSFEMRGPASTEHLVLSLALAYPTTGLQWMHPVHAGMVGVFQPNVAVDAINRGKVSFAVIDIPHAELALEAERSGIAINPRWLAASGVAAGAVQTAHVARLSRLVAMRHRGLPVALPPGWRLDTMILSATIGQLGPPPEIEHHQRNGTYHRIVTRARAYIDAHLDDPIAIDDLVAAAITSRRTLHRAFFEILDETPQSYVLKLRLNRIRRDLASPTEAERTVTTVSHRWGIAELGRLAARYREQFGELPSETLARRRHDASVWHGEQAQSA